MVDDTVFIGVLNGTFMARDAETGKVLWEFQTDASKENKGWVLTANRRFNIRCFPSTTGKRDHF